MLSAKVRETAIAVKMPNAFRKDSQGICFLGKINYNDFIKRHLGIKKACMFFFTTYHGPPLRPRPLRCPMVWNQKPLCSPSLRPVSSWITGPFFIPNTEKQYGKTLHLAEMHFISGNPWADGCDRVNITSLGGLCFQVWWQSTVLPTLRWQPEYDKVRLLVREGNRSGAVCRYLRCGISSMLRKRHNYRTKYNIMSDNQRIRLKVLGISYSQIQSGAYALSFVVYIGDLVRSAMPIASDVRESSTIVRSPSVKVSSDENMPSSNLYMNTSFSFTPNAWAKLTTWADGCDRVNITFKNRHMPEFLPATLSHVSDDEYVIEFGLRHVAYGKYEMWKLFVTYASQKVSLVFYRVNSCSKIYAVAYCISSGIMTGSI